VNRHLKRRLIDTSLATPEEAAHGVRERLRSRARYGGADLLSEDWDEEDDEGEDVLTPRTRAVLHLALQKLSDQAWQEVSTLGDQPLQRAFDGVFGSLPRVTWHLGPVRSRDHVAGWRLRSQMTAPRS
jgi:hypothetical protein